MKKSISVCILLLSIAAARSDSREQKIPMEQINNVFGTALWQDTNLWDDSASDVAGRLKLKLESRTDFTENHRSYPLGRKKLLSEPVYAIALYGRKGMVDSLSIIFLNQGDIPIPNGIISPRTLKAIAKKIEQMGKRIYDRLVPILGKPKRDALGKGPLREKVWRWDWNDHALMLSVQEGKYVVLRIMPTARADRGGRNKKVKEHDLRERLKSCVGKRGNGDVVIRNIPMINQGPKGYCSPATWERYLRYMDISADMYLLALAAGTNVGGGTESNLMIEATRQLVSANGRELKKVRSSLRVKEIAKYIDEGLPLIWHLASTPQFQRTVQENTRRRQGKAPGQTAREDSQKKQAEFTRGGGHVCLIIGYNAKTNELAISDSWGPRFAERWVPVKDAQHVSTGILYIIKW